MSPNEDYEFYYTYANGSVSSGLEQKGIEKSYENRENGGRS